MKNALQLFFLFSLLIISFSATSQTQSSQEPLSIETPRGSGGVPDCPIPTVSIQKIDNQYMAITPTDTTLATVYDVNQAKFQFYMNRNQILREMEVYKAKIKSLDKTLARLAEIEVELEQE